MPAVLLALVIFAFVLAFALALVSTVLNFAFGIIGLTLRVVPVVLVALVAWFFLSGGRVRREPDGRVTITMPPRRPRG